MTFSLQLGQVVPNFECVTNKGRFMLHDYLKEDPQCPYTILMSHPKDYSPICTTELGQAEHMADEFHSKGVRLLALSGDSVQEHDDWSKDILARENIKGKKALSYPIIADERHEISKALGLLDPATKKAGGEELPSRALLVLDKSAKVRLAVLYPAMIGRNFDEILRTIDSLCLVDKHGVATPCNWHPGDKAAVPPSISPEEAKKKFGHVDTQSVPSGKEYLRFVDPPR